MTCARQNLPLCQRVAWLRLLPPLLESRGPDFPSIPKFSGDGDVLTLLHWLGKVKKFVLSRKSPHMNEEQPNEAFMQEAMNYVGSAMGGRGGLSIMLLVNGSKRGMTSRLYAL